MLHALTDRAARPMWNLIRRPTGTDVLTHSDGAQIRGVSGDSQGLTVVDLQLPPLRERRDEIPALASFFLSRFIEEYDRPAELSPEILGLFGEYAWPRNIRELEELVRRLVVTGTSRSIQEEIRSHLRLARLA